jgi:hypothetical protein
MRIKLVFFVVFSAFLVTMCGRFAERELANPIDGLSCRASAGRGMECHYTCPEGTVGPILFEGDPSLSLSKGDFDRRYCDIAPESTSTVSPASPSPSPTSSPTPEPTATVVVPVTARDPLLAETVSMCDLGGKLINFRLLEPSPELAAETLDVKIAEQDSTCYVNPTNPSLLTCTVPNEIRFPAQVVVSLDGVIVNDFLYSGVGCSILTTPTSRPRSYP